MGLDAVEIVMEMEEEFDLTIPDSEAQEIETVGDLYRYVLGRLGLDDDPPATPVTLAVPGEPCPNLVVFHRLRRSLMHACGIARGAVKPSADLADLLPIRRREENWRRLEQSLGVRLPWLAPNEFDLGTRALCNGLLAIACATAYLAYAFDWTYILLASLLTIPLLWAYLSRPEPREFPDGFETVGAAVHTLAATRPNLLGRQRIRADDRAALSVWRRICEIISEQLDVRMDQLTEETHFVRDLDCC